MKFNGMRLCYKKNLLLMYVILGVTSLKALNPPVLTSPSNNTSQWTGLELDWNGVSGSDKHQLEIDTSSNFNSNAKRVHTENYTGYTSSTCLLYTSDAADD